MKIEISAINSATSDGEMLIVSAITKHAGEMTLSISRQEIIQLLDSATLRRVLTVQDLEGVLSRIAHVARVFRK